ncbi:MAG: hypothetical protein HKN35_11555 [Woeseia sp.]|nr:hypothetical protein [Woeseia sp.]
MKTLAGLAIFTTLSMILAACGGGVAPYREPVACATDEYVVCTRKVASRVKGQADEYERCRCERIENID